MCEFHDERLRAIQLCELSLFRPYLQTRYLQLCGISCGRDQLRHASSFVASATRLLESEMRRDRLLLIIRSIFGGKNAVKCTNGRYLSVRQMQVYLDVFTTAIQNIQILDTAVASHSTLMAFSHIVP